MGLAKLGDPTILVLDALTRTEEKIRRAFAKRRVALYRDDFEQILYNEIVAVFQDPAVRERFYPLMRMSGANSFLKRIADELARPLYATPPRRKVTGPAGVQEAYHALANEMRLNAKMSLTARLLVAANSVIQFPRVVPGKGMCLDVMTPDMVTVFPDPDRPTKALSITYDRMVYTAKGPTTHHVTWDDEQAFEMNANGDLVANPVRHSFGRIPMVEIHRRERWGEYWDNTTGKDLEAAALQTMLLNAMALKLHKSQSHKQLAFIGDVAGWAKNQTLDEESLLVGNGQGTLQSIDLQGDPSFLLKTKEAIETSVAANYGISRERLNQKAGSEGGDDHGLKERTAELAQVMREAEADLFEVVTLVSREHPTHRLAEGGAFSIDYGALHYRVDRKTQLEIRKMERSMGVRSILDDVYEDNPEITSEDEAWEEIADNMAAEAAYIEERRALNIAEDATAEEPGQDPAQNGAMGPKVRDGRMTRDEAADVARTGADPEETIQ